MTLGDLDGDNNLDAVALDSEGVTVWLNATAPTLSIGDVTVTEGNLNSVLATFTITRSGNVFVASSVQWSTLDGSAAAPSDYMPVGPTTVNFAAGETTKTVSVIVNGDTAMEADEGFTVKLSNPVTPAIGDGTGLGTITDDDSAAFAVNNATVAEDDSGTTLATFTISRSGSTAATSTVQWSTVNNSATAGSDYVAVSPTTVSFHPGDTTKQVSVRINGDTQGEANETFFVKLSSPKGATISDDTGLGVITNDDTALAVNDVTVTEGDSGPVLANFTITRTGPTGGTSSVEWTTANYSAGAGSDYVAVPPTTLTFAPGETTKSVSVTVNGDILGEPDESFLVKLSSPTGATILDGSVSGSSPTTTPRWRSTT